MPSDWRQRQQRTWPEPHASGLEALRTADRIRDSASASPHAVVQAPPFTEAPRPHSIPRATPIAQELWSFTITWRAGMIERVIGRNDVDGARAGAQRLAEERR